MSNRKLVSFRLPDDLMDALREQSDHDGISVTELVCRLLRQGLRHSQEADAAESNLVDQRIAILEEELRELKTTKPPMQSVTPTALHTLLAQSLMGSENIEIKNRLTQLEKMQESNLESNLEMRNHLTQIEQLMATLVAQAKE
jgi:hypothetical protein